MAKKRNILAASLCFLSLSTRGRFSVSRAIILHSSYPVWHVSPSMRFMFALYYSWKVGFRRVARLAGAPSYHVNRPLENGPNTFLIFPQIV